MENMGTKSLIKVVPSFVLLISFITKEENPWEMRLIGKRQQMGYMTNSTTRGVSHCGLAISRRKYLKAKEEYGNSNISPCKNIIFKKIL
jgi:hypothetical protein